MSDTTRKGVKEMLGGVSESMSDFSGKAREMASDFAEEAVARGRKAARYAVKDVKEHPIRYVTIGVAVGVLVAALIMRNRNDD
jgi:ElaB/YqjD/DUF883 family membrane-anchored ribosome-binding protein